jgi:hypothetical protein
MKLRRGRGDECHTLPKETTAVSGQQHYGRARVNFVGLARDYKHYNAYRNINPRMTGLTLEYRSNIGTGTAVLIVHVLLNSKNAI